MGRTKPSLRHSKAGCEKWRSSFFRQRRRIFRKVEASDNCASLKRRGRPERCPSASPARPWASKRRTQYSTVRGEGRRQASGRLPDRSLPAPPTTPHGAGDHTEILPNGESRLAVPKSSSWHQRFAVVSCLHETTNP
jgi:hypothetical protein